MKGKRKKRIVVIGGGTGTYTVLSGLKGHDVELSAVVSMADDGGSTRILREEFGILPPGSVRPAMVALSEAEKSLADLFNFRFENGSGLSGHNFGNLFITALTKHLGSFEKAVEEAGRILHIKGRVIPSTLGYCTLMAELENGKVVRGEHAIDVPLHDGNLRIRKIWLERPCKANPKAKEAILKADLVVIGPGDLFSSVLPNLLLYGIRDAVQTTKARKAYVCNIMTKFGETAGFTASGFVSVMEQYLGDGVLDYVICNTKKPSLQRIAKYEKTNSEFVKCDLAGAKFRVIAKPLVRSQGFIRHDPTALANVILSL
ncbi:MAG: YvcK family protein, partial [bacterium]|nr:YvcK family protein [bacterium]